MICYEPSYKITLHMRSEYIGHEILDTGDTVSRGGGQQKLTKFNNKYILYSNHLICREQVLQNNMRLEWKTLTVRNLVRWELI